MGLTMCSQLCTQFNSPAIMLSTKDLFSVLRRLISDIKTSLNEEAMESNFAVLDEIVRRHQLTNAPRWMVDIFYNIVIGNHLDCFLRIPREYPNGDDGITNVLFDIDRDVTALLIDDYGEGMTWILPHLGTSVVVLRETTGPFALFAVLPQVETDDINGWLVAEARRHPEGLDVINGLSLWRTPEGSTSTEFSDNL